jgi:hypothetical protein
VLAPAVVGAPAIVAGEVVDNLIHIARIGRNIGSEFKNILEARGE